MTFLFVDTNVLLHYRRLEEIDWLDLSKSKEVVIVLCPAVIRELDQHKVSHPRNKFRKRAQEIITSLHSRLSGVDSDVIRNGVRLEFITEDPSIDFGAHKLRPELPDDWLIASAIDWKQKHSSDETRIVSADLGISIKAKVQGIPALAPLEADKLGDELDADERKIKELQRELAEIKNSLPRLKLCFWGQPEDQNFVRFQIPPPLAFDNAKAETVLQQIHSQHPPHPIPDAAQEHAAMKQLEKQLWKGNMNVRFPISGAEFQRYNKELTAFYQAYDTYLHKLHDYQNARRRMISFEVGLQNTGTTPGEDIDVHLHFPDGFQLLNGDEALPPPPQPPKLPRQPGAFEGIDMSALHAIGRIPTAPRPAGPPPNVSSPLIRRTNSFDVRSQIKKAKHGYTLRVANFVAVFSSDDALSSFKIDYSISAANLPKAVNDHLSVIIEKSS
jgi:predicted nucleic acid-binding protein